MWCDLCLQHITFKPKWIIWWTWHSQIQTLDSQVESTLFLSGHFRWYSISGPADWGIWFPICFVTDFGWVLTGNASNHASRLFATFLHTYMASGDDILWMFCKIEEQLMEHSSQFPLSDLLYSILNNNILELQMVVLLFLYPRNHRPSLLKCLESKQWGTSCLWKNTSQISPKSYIQLF